MAELLAPAGSMEALKAAAANGCDAVYLGMQRFGARAYSSNFDSQGLKEAVTYAHIRNIKVYVTMNTIVFEDELEDVYSQLDFINQLGVDGVITADMAVFKYIVNNFADLEAHCSTQMGIDDLDGALFWKELGAARIVVAREMDIDSIKELRKKADIPVEVFIHGALCVSYSGNCLMSGLIGYRSGNRGRCVGSCRKQYELFNLTSGQSLGKSYLLSTKDLNTIKNIRQLKDIDSLKIEGRMKEPSYVANVVSKYRKALDGKYQPGDDADLCKTFNRTYTKGYIFGEDKKDITNILKPNNFGIEAGKITGSFKGMYEITLRGLLNQNDIIRIDHEGEDVNLSLIRMYDREGRLINSADKKCYIKIQEKLSVGDKVYKTRDVVYYRQLETMLEGEYRHFPLDFTIYAWPDAPLVVEARGLGCSCSCESSEVLSAARNQPTSPEQVEKQLDRLGDTVFCLGRVEFEETGAYIPAKLLNQARREVVRMICDKKVSEGGRRIQPEPEDKVPMTAGPVHITASVMNESQYQACLEAGIEEIYFKNIIRRNQNDYAPAEGLLLIGGYGGIHHYRDTNEFITDYSLNVVNSVSCRQLHKMGAKRVTLSYEINRRQLEELVSAYRRDNGGPPALEMIVYGRAPLMFTKYCPLKKMGQCGACRSSSYELRDEYGQFPIVSYPDCTTSILNGKILNLLDEMPSIEGVEAFRLSFTTESPEEVKKTASAALAKLRGELTDSLFDRERDTRGHFNKEIL